MRCHLLVLFVVLLAGCFKKPFTNNLGSSEESSSPTVKIDGPFAPNLSLAERTFPVGHSSLDNIEGTCDPEGGDVKISGSGVHGLASVPCGATGTFSMSIATYFINASKDVSFSPGVGVRNFTISQGANSSASSFIVHIPGFPPEYIATKAELAALPTGAASDGKLYILTADIDFSEGGAVPTNNWTPIGTNASAFFSSIDGNGHKLRNLNINLPAQSSVGLIGTNKQGITSSSYAPTFSNIIFENANVRGQSNVGVLMGFGEDLYVDNVQIGQGEINGTSGVGGLVGAADVASFSDIYFSNVTVQGTGSTGGIISVTGGTVERCLIVEGVTNSTGDEVGGVIGRLNGTAMDISDVAYIGEMYGKNYVGGIVGRIANGGITFSQVYSYANIFSLSGTANRGYLFGTSNATIGTGVFYGTNTSCATCDVSAGVGLSDAQFANAANFPTYDFVNIWSPPGYFPLFR